MADDDLEYHITFPSPTPSTLPATDDGQTPQSLSQNQAVSTDDDPTGMGLIYSGDGQNYTEKEPVVILLGWVGCKDKYLSKYSDMYDKKGCITIRYTAPPEAIFLNPRRTETIAQKICELIPELGLEDNPIFFHVFSNGGGFVYRSITELLHKDDRYSMVSVRGCVFDSCPGYRRLRSAARAFLATLSTYNVIVQYILGGLLIVYLSLYRIYDSVVSMFQKKDSVHRFFEAMLNDKARWPQLYLYSKADKIIPYEDIEEVLSHRRSLGILVYSVCWDDSPHVAHMRVHPNSYTQQCTYFIDKCLQVSV